MPLATDLGVLKPTHRTEWQWLKASDLASPVDKKKCEGMREHVQLCLWFLSFHELDGA